MPRWGTTKHEKAIFRRKEFSKSMFEFIGIANSRGQQSVLEAGEQEGKSKVHSDYPFVIHGDAQSLARLANQVYEQWASSVERDNAWKRSTLELEVWRDEASERKRLWVSAFIDGYEKALETWPY